MEPIRIGNPVVVKWTFKHTDGTPFPVADYSPELFFYTGRGKTKVTDTTVLETSGNLLVWHFNADAQPCTGAYSLALKVYLQGNLVGSFDCKNAFILSNSGTVSDNPIEVDLVSRCDFITLNEAIQNARLATDAAVEAAGRTETAIDDAEAAAREAREAAARIGHGPDEEDITLNAQDYIQFKDRPSTDGMGYVILRRSKTFAEQVTEANTIYEIRYGFNLGTEAVAIPENCVLKFIGGKIENGTLVGNGTMIDAPKVPIFNSVAISGTWNVNFIHSEWLEDGASTNSLVQLFNLTDANIDNTVYIGNGTYNLASSTAKDILVLKSNTTVVLTGTIQLEAGNIDKVRIFGTAVGASNVRITGGGNIIGDKMITSMTVGEKKHGIMLNDSTDVIIENINIRNCFGDGICIGGSSNGDDNVNTNVQIRNVKIDNCRRQGISVIYAENVTIDNCVITNISGTAPQTGIDIEPNSNGYCRNITVSNCKFSGNASQDIALFTNTGTAGIDYSTKIHNIHIFNCTGTKAISCQYCSNVYVENVKMGFYASANIFGKIYVTNSQLKNPDSPTQYVPNVYLENCSIQITRSINLRYTLNECYIENTDESVHYANVYDVTNTIFNNVRAVLMGTRFSGNTMVCSGMTYDGSQPMLYVNQAGDYGDIIFKMTSCSVNVCLSAKGSIGDYSFNRVAYVGDSAPVNLVYMPSGTVCYIKHFIPDVTYTRIKDGSGNLYYNRDFIHTADGYIQYDRYPFGIYRSGTFAQRPSASDIRVGYAYYCTDRQTTEGASNGIIIYHRGSDVWVDALGRTVS